MFTNEHTMKCYHCGGIVTRERRPSCFDWCKYADKCMAEIAAQRSGAADKAPRCPEDD